MYQQITIKTLNKQGKKNVEIAEEMSCHRNTVHNILSLDNPMEKQTRSKPSYFTQYYDRIKAWLKTGITRVRIREMLRDEYGIDKPYITLCKYVEKYCSEPKTAYVVQETVPGEEAEVDFGYLGILPAPTGERKKTWGFVMTLSYSRDTFYTTVTDQSVVTLIRIHEEAFSFFGGVPRRVKVDNLKAAILKNYRYDLEFNKDFLSFAYYYGFVIAPCTPYEPQQKGKVESGVGYVKGNFLPGRVFDSYADLVQKLNYWRDYTANTRIHGTTRRIPHDVFLVEEKKQLQPLPEIPFVYQPALTRLVKPNCHINVERCYYSVPSKLVGTEVEVRLSGSLVRIVSGNEEVAVHTRNHVPGSYVTNHSHYPGYKIYSQTTYQKKHEDKMLSIGPSAHTLFNRVVKEDPQGWVKTIRNILGMANDFGIEKTEKAIKRALAYGATSGSIIRSICEKQLEDTPIEPALLTVLNPAGGDGKPDSALIRELSYYQPCGIYPGDTGKQAPVLPKDAFLPGKLIDQPVSETGNPCL